MKRLLVVRKKGFTLIELMIVIAIIAILAAILIPNFIRARAQSQLAACESNLKNIGTSMEMYSTDWNGRYFVGGAGTALITLVPNYMRTVPVCPAIVPGTYVYTGTNTGYTTNQTAGNNNPHATAGLVPAGAAACNGGNCPSYAGGAGLLI